MTPQPCTAQCQPTASRVEHRPSGPGPADVTSAWGSATPGASLASCARRPISPRRGSPFRAASSSGRTSSWTSCAARSISSPAVRTGPSSPNPAVNGATSFAWSSERASSARWSSCSDSGVYVTVDEYKGRRPLRRGRLTMELRPELFLNSLVSPHVWGRTSGSSGPSTPTPIDFAWLRERAINSILLLDARGGAVPGVTPPGARPAAGSATSGRPRLGLVQERWFWNLDPVADRLHPRHRWAYRALRLGCAWAPLSAPSARARSLRYPLADPAVDLSDASRSPSAESLRVRQPGDPPVPGRVRRGARPHRRALHGDRRALDRRSSGRHPAGRRGSGPHLRHHGSRRRHRRELPSALGARRRPRSPRSVCAGPARTGRRAGRPAGARPAGLDASADFALRVHERLARRPGRADAPELRLSARAPRLDGPPALDQELREAHRRRHDRSRHRRDPRPRGAAARSVRRRPDRLPARGRRGVGPEQRVSGC